MERIEVVDFLLVAELVAGYDAHALASMPRVLDLAESALAAPFAEYDGVAAYPDLSLRAAVLCARLVRNRPLPDANERVALVCMVELIQRNGRVWTPAAGAAERAEMVERLAAGTVTEHDFARWVERQIA